MRQDASAGTYASTNWESEDFLSGSSSQLTLQPEKSPGTPWLMGIFCLLLTIIPSDVVSPDFPANFATPARMLAGLFGLLAVLSFLESRERYPWGIRVNPGVVLIGVYVSLSLIVWARGLLLPGTLAQEFAKATAFSGGFIGSGIALYAMVRLTTPGQRSFVLGSLVAGIAYSGLVGILQHTSIGSIEYALIPPGFEQTGVNFLTTGGQAIRRGAIRAIGTFLNPLPFGATCAMAVPLAFHFARYASRRSGRALGLLATSMLLLAVPTSIARSSLIVLAVSTLFYAIGLKLSRILTILIATGGVALLISLISFNTLQALWETITESAEDPSVLIRLVQTDKMLEIFDQNPVFGLGLGSVTIADFGVVDNSTTILLAEGGIVGAAAWAAVAVGGIFGINGALRRAATEKERDQVYATGGMFLGLLSATPTFAILHDPTYSILFLLFGILWSGCSYSIGTAPAQGSLPARRRLAFR